MTIKDLARLSGYSLGTVSRVLNNQPNVSEKARQAIPRTIPHKDAVFNLLRRNAALNSTKAHSF